MQTKSFVETSVDNIYYNIQMYNSSSQSVPASYIETRVTPLLQNPSEWLMCPVRFSIPGSDVPIFIAQALPFPNTDINILQYSVTLTRNGTSSGETNLVWDPTYNSVSVPLVDPFTATMPSQNQDDFYYYVYSYQYMVDLINQALAQAYAALPDKGSTTAAPFMTYNPDSNLFSIYAQTSYFQNSNPQNISNLIIWFNRQLFDFFPSFDVIFNGYNPANNTNGYTGAGMNFGIVVKNNNNNMPFTIQPAGNTGATGYYEMIQEYSTMFSWNWLQSISFRSNTIPVVQEANTGVAGKMGESLYGSVTSNQIAFITDFEPYNTTTPGIFRETLQFAASSDLRLVDLIGNQPLATIDLQCYWTDQNGFVHQITIPPRGVLTLKLLFRRRSFYSDRGRVRGSMITEGAGRYRRN